MSFLTRLALRNASAIAIVCILVILGGIYSSFELKKETMPDISIPVVAVITAYPGAAPNDVQDNITKPIENLVSSVNGVKSVDSTSSENVSSIILQFDFSADMNEAQRKIEEVVKNAKLPEGAMAPKITRINFGSFPVLNVSISNEQTTPEELEQKVRENVLPSLGGIDGVGQVQLASESQKAVFIKLIPSKLKEYNLTSQQVMQLLQANNITLPAGSVSLNETVQPIRVAGNFDSLDELKNMQLAIMPNMQEGLKSTFTQFGEGMGALGQAVGKLGQGLAGINQALNGQIQLLSAIQQTQAQIFADKLALNEANATLKDPNSTEEQKQQATASVQILGPKIQMTEVALQQMQGTLREIQAKLSQAPANAGNGPQSSGTPSFKLDSSQNTTESAKLKQVALGEIAEITLGTGQTTSFSRTNGSPSVVVQVLKTQDANTVDVADAVKKKLDDIKSKLPEGTNFTTILDQSDAVKESINGMLKEALFGALFAFLTILIFLRNFRTTLIATVSIPLSVLITMVFLKQLDINLNIMTLGGLSVATGRIVDDSIVVIENIYSTCRLKRFAAWI